GRIQISVAGKDTGMPTLLPFHLGDTLDAAGGYRVRIVDASADFDPNRDRSKNQNTKALPEQKKGVAALWVEILPPAGGAPEPRILREALDPVEVGLQDKYLHKEVVLQFEWDNWSAPGPPRYLLSWSADAAPELVGQDGSRAPVTVGKALALPGK